MALSHMWIASLMWIFMQYQTEFCFAVVTPDTLQRAPVELHRESAEIRLAVDLMGRRQMAYLARPVLDASETMTVYFGISPVQLLSVDEKNQVLTMLLWKQYSWVDQFLTWSPQDYGDIDTIRLPMENLWTPDIILYNNVGKRGAERHDARLTIRYDGLITWIPPVIYSSSCLIDVSNFPFDKQNCSLKFGSWTYSSKQMDLQFVAGLDGGLDMSEYINSTEWDLVGYSSQRTSRKYSCCPNTTYVDLIFIFVIHRRHGFFTQVMLIPALLLAIAVVFIFWIPAQRPDRTTLGLSLFTSFMLQLLLLVEISPPTSETTLGTFCSINVFVVVSATLISIAMINLSTWIGPMNPKVRKIFVVVLPRLLHMHIMVDPTPRPAQKSTRKRNMTNRRKNSKSTDVDQSIHVDMSKYTSCYSKGEPYKSHLHGHEVQKTAPAGNVKDSAASDTLGPLKLPGHSSASDWRIMVATIDRLLFIIYLIFMVVCIALFFPKPW